MRAAAASLPPTDAAEDAAWCQIDSGATLCIFADFLHGSIRNHLHMSRRRLPSFVCAHPHLSLLVYHPASPCTQLFNDRLVHSAIGLVSGLIHSCATTHALSKFS
ncbi:hypothetical protein BS78_06G051300 [Paspalum vaginatum]|nr:hypothetical protein BS78_06G051300 [Paspalum vaginatum]